MIQKSINSFRLWHELKQRKVIRVIIVYVATGFAIIEFIDIVTVPLNLPEWLLKLAIILIAAGFPLAVVLAWRYGFKTNSFHPSGSPLCRVK